MSISDSYFSEILSPYVKPKTLKALTNEGDLCTYKVLLNQNKKNGESVNDQNKKNGESINDQNTPYLLISKQCFDHSNTFVFIQNFYQQYHFSHPAIMPLYQLSISPNNSFEAYYKYPANGKLSDYIGFAHENILSQSKELTPTQKSIISYGLAHALSYIHKHNYLFGEVNAKNVYLDEEFRPYLTNFYSIKKINDQRVSKSKRLTDMHLKIDVYTYSIIYAALIEPISFDPPVQSTQEFFERLNNRKRPVCNEEKTTEKQRELLSQMWSYIPRDRLSFDQIVEHFENGDLLFKGTNNDEFEKYKLYLKENQNASFTPPLSPCPSSSHKNAPSSATILSASQEVLNENNYNNYESIQKDEEEISKPVPFNEDDNQINIIQYRTREIKPILSDENEKEISNESDQQQPKNNDFLETVENDDTDLPKPQNEEENNESTTYQQFQNDEIQEEEEEPEFFEQSKFDNNESNTIEVQNDENQQIQQKIDDISDNDYNQQEQIKDSYEQPHESDQDQEKGFNDWQPTEKNHYEDDQNVESNAAEDNKQENEKNVESKNNENNQKSNNNKDTNEKKLDVLFSRHDDVGFKECNDDASSIHSYDQEDDDDNIISQTESVESDIQFLDVGGDVELESDPTN